jgi:uncharacterized protein (DUF433 family)
MFSTPTAVDVPLRTDEDGVIRVGETRVTLLTIVGCHNRGDTPQEIHEGFPTVSLAEIYAVIAYYLAHQEEVDDYIRHVTEEAERVRREHEANNPQTAAFNTKMRATLAEKM